MDLRKMEKRWQDAVLLKFSYDSNMLGISLSSSFHYSGHQGNSEGVHM